MITNLNVNKKNNKKSKKNDWYWTLMVLFLTLSIMDFRFGILGILCMTAPLYHVLKGEGKIHCQKYCPRGSILGKFLQRISLNNPMPKFMTTKKFKNALLTLMMVVFSFSMYHAGPDFNKIAFSIFRFMTVSLIIGVIMGILYKPRSWCVVCPMGYGSGLLDKQMKKNQKMKEEMVYTFQKSA